jgi:hypothetical protein
VYQLISNLINVETTGLTITSSDLFVDISCSDDYVFQSNRETLAFQKHKASVEYVVGFFWQLGLT